MVFLVLLLGLGSTLLTKYGFVINAAVWTVCFSAYGIIAKPGPKLTGKLRSAFGPLHIALMILLAFTAISVVRADYGPLSGQPRMLCLLSLGLGLLHGCFHLWRHTALRDGALRNMTPKFMHGKL